MPSQPTILIVDDDTDGRFFAERSLKKILGDCTLLQCASADAALALLEGTRVDAVVTDNKLGRKSGCEFIGQARQNGLTCPLIMVTCNDDPNVARDAYRAGATKVFRTGGDEFAEFLKERLEASRPADEGAQGSSPPAVD